MTGSTPGPSRIEWVRSGCRLLGSIAAEFARTRPFDGLTIGTGIHLEPKTVALLLTAGRGRRAGGLHRQPVQHPGGRGRVSPRAGGRGDRRGHHRPGRARRVPPAGDRHPAAPAAGQRRRPVRAVPGRAVPGVAGRHRGDDLGPDAAAPPGRPAGRPGPGHQRQPDQAVRGEPARGRPERARVVPAHHQPDDQRPAGRGLRVRGVREGRGGQLPERVRVGRGGRDRPGDEAGSEPRRLRRPGPRGGPAQRGRGDHRDRGRVRDHRGRPGPAEGRGDAPERRALPPGDRRG